jgi:cell wall-associated NlpC family hydrolase
LEDSTVRQDRRKFLIGLGAAPLALAASRGGASAQTPSPKTIADFPDAAGFRSGDLVWPKKKGTIVPKTRSLAPAAPTQDRRDWEAARQQMLANPAAMGLSPDVAERLRTLSYEEFERVYFTGPVQPSGPTTRSMGALGPVSVGHVGFIELDAAGVPHIIEATPTAPDGTKGGVIRLRYADWLKGYTNIQVWHGRLRDLDAQATRRVLDVARSQLGKPYDFFNFDLNDDRGFYCSKLVWMCIWRAARIAADDNPDPQRGSRFPPWFSPKALIGARRVAMLHSPGEY